MTKEELEKEAENFIIDRYKLNECYREDNAETREYMRMDVHSQYEEEYQLYIAGAEPREKRIVELEAQIGKMKVKWHDLEKDPNDLPKNCKTMCICLSDFGSKYEPVPQVCVGYCDSLGWSDYMGSSLYSNVRHWCELPQA